MKNTMYSPGLLFAGAPQWKVINPSTKNGVSISPTAQSEHEKEIRKKEIEEFQKNFDYVLDNDGIPHFKNTHFAAW